MRPLVAAARRSVPAALLFLAAPLPVVAQGALTVVDNPGGGQYVYGPIAAGASERAVVVDMLTRIHHRFGDSPRVGRVLRNSAGQSLAAFFDVRTGAPGGGPVSGMIILSEPQGRPGMAAVLYDESQRFPATAGQMLKGLAAATGGGSGPSAAGPRASSDAAGGNGSMPYHATAPAASLTDARFPDGSGSVGLPAGWNIAEAYQGYAMLKGPRGEVVILSRYFPVEDPRNPRTARLIQTTGLPGSYLAIPYGTDPTRTYLTLVEQVARKQRRQPAEVRIVSAERKKAPGGADFFAIAAQADAHDGVGMRDLLVQLYPLAPFDAAGNWSLILFQFSVPQGEMNRQLATFSEMRKSYRLNAQVIQGETQAGIARQKAWFNAQQSAMKANQDAFQSRLDQQAAADASQGKRNQAFSNYLLDQTAITDTRTGAQGTVSNAYAWSLMRHDSHFQEVPTEDLLKGVTW
jgi:hypothetical protein